MEYASNKKQEPVMHNPITEAVQAKKDEKARDKPRLS